MMLEVKNFTILFDSMRIRIFNQSYPPNKFFGPPHGIGGVGGLGSPIISTPISHFIKGSESVKLLGVRGIMAV